MDPLYYVRETEVVDNTYSHDKHLNNKVGKPYKKGDAKRRMLGLEEVGWIPIYSKEELYAHLESYHSDPPEPCYE